MPAKKIRHVRSGQPSGTSDMIILFLLYEGFTHSAYSARQAIVGLRIKEWIPLSEKTVYNTMKRLADQELVKGIRNKNHAAPERTDYNITEKGKEHLISILTKEFTSVVRDYFHFDLCLGLNSYVPFEIKITAINKRIECLSERFEELTGRLANYKSKSPFAEWILLDREIFSIKNEIAWLERLIVLIKEDYERRKYTSVNRKNPRNSQK